MSTQSRIAYHDPEKGIIRATTAHYDGHPDRTGRILLSYYDSFDQALDLVEGGSYETIRRFPNELAFFDALADPEQERIFFGLPNEVYTKEVLHKMDFEEYQRRSKAKNAEYEISTYWGKVCRVSEPEDHDPVEEWKTFTGLKAAPGHLGVAFTYVYWDTEWYANYPYKRMPWIRLAEFEQYMDDHVYSRMKP